MLLQWPGSSGGVEGDEICNKNNRLQSDLEESKKLTAQSAAEGKTP